VAEPEVPKDLVVLSGDPGHLWMVEVAGRCRWL
jgi:hypothetical protein